MARTSFSGPATGAYANVMWTLDDIAASEVTILRWVAPAAGRVQETSAFNDAHTGTIDYQITNQTTTNDIVATRALPAADTVETLTPTSTPALANRTFSKGDIVRLTVTAGVGESMEGLTVSLAVFFTGHVVAAQADD